MGNTITFDTLAFSKRLVVKEGEFTQKQAEALANAQREAFEEMVSTRELATKADIARLENKMDGRLAEMEVRLTKAMYNALVGFAAVIAAVVIGSVSVAMLFLK